MKPTVLTLCLCWSLGVALAQDPEGAKRFTNQMVHAASVRSVAFSPNGKSALSGSDDHTLKLWDLATRKEIKTLTGHSASVRSVAFSPDGKTALSGSDDHTLKLWDIVTGKEIRTLIGHTDDVESVAFSPDGKTALSASWDQTLKLWDISTGKTIKSFIGHSKLVLCVVFSPDGKTVLSGSHDNTLKLWDIATGKELKTLTGHAAYVYSVAFSPDGKTALSGSYDNTLKLWDTTTGKEIKTLTGHAAYVRSLAFSPDGKMALSGSEDKALKLWDTTTGKELKTLTGHSSRVTSVAFSPDGKTALSGSYDNTLKLWDIATGKAIKTLTGHAAYVYSVAFSPDGKTALSGSWDHTLKLWDISTGKAIKTLTGHSDAVYLVAFSPDGKTALSGSMYNLKLWDITTGKELKTLTGHSSRVTSVAFSPDGKTTLSGSYDNTLKLWDIATGKEIKTLTGHASSVESVAFSPDGKTALSGSEDKTLKLWDLATGKVQSSKSINFPLIHISFSSDGKVIRAGTAAYWITSSFQEGSELPIDSTVADMPASPPAVTQPTVQPQAPFTQVIWKTEESSTAQTQFQLKAAVVSSVPVHKEAVRLYQNGQWLSGQKMGEVLLTAKSPYQFSQTVQLNEGINRFELGVTHPNQAELRSEPLFINYLPPTKPDLYMVSIGVNGMGLEYPATDAQSVIEVFNQQQGKLFRQVRSDIYNQTQYTTADNLRNSVGVLSSLGITPNDVLVIFVSAHGKKFNNQKGKTDFAILASNYKSTNIITEENTSLLYEAHLLEYLKPITCKKLIFFDACHSGQAGMAEGAKARYLMDLLEAQEVVKRTPAGIVTIASSGDGQLSYEDAVWQHGAFTKALVEGLRGAADADKDGYVFVSELFSYIAKVVPPMVKQVKQQEQTPQMYPKKISTEQDFPIVQY
ncbi:MAG: caspase family protein [Spirosomataceae bacterium]